MLHNYNGNFMDWASFNTKSADILSQEVKKIHPFNKKKKTLFMF